MDDLESNYIMGKRPFFFFFYRGPGGSVSWVVGSNSSYKPITNTAWVRARLCRLQKGCTRLAATSDKVYQLLAHGRWFSPGTPASSTTKTGRHDIAEILLNVVLKHQKSIFFFKNNCLHCSEDHYRYIPWCMEWSVIRLYC
jgi:hypothetical protein